MMYGDEADVDIKVTQAFWYLGSGKPKIWELLPKAGKGDELERLIAGKEQIKEPSQTKRRCRISPV